MPGPVSTVPVVQVFDLRAEPCELASHRWTAHLRRDPAKIRGVVLHQWGTEVTTTGGNRLRWGEPLALARRALRAPYGVSCGVTRAGVPVVAVAHPLERYTYASDAGNAHYLAVGVMGRFPYFAADYHPARHTDWSDAMDAALARALEVAVNVIENATLADFALPDPPLALITHRQCANEPADHFVCPGEHVVEASLRSEAVRAGVLVPDPDLVILPKYGKTWTAEWRRYLPKNEADLSRTVAFGDGALQGDVSPPPAI